MSEVPDVRCRECGTRWEGAVKACGIAWTCARCQKTAAKSPRKGTLRQTSLNPAQFMVSCICAPTTRSCEVGMASRCATREGAAREFMNAGWSFVHHEGRLENTWRCKSCRDRFGAEFVPLAEAGTPIRQCSGCQYFSTRNPELKWHHNTETDKWYCPGCTAMSDVAWRMQETARKERAAATQEDDTKEAAEWRYPEDSPVPTEMEKKMDEKNRVTVTRCERSRVTPTLRFSVMLGGLTSIDITVPEQMLTQEWDDLVKRVAALRNPNAA